MPKKSLYVLIAAALGALAASSEAARSEAGATARQGVVRCGGNHHLRLSGTEVHFTHYALRNFDASTAIVIDRIRVFDGPGSVVFDSAIGGLPVSENGLLGPGNNVLAPNQSAVIDSHEMVPAYLPDVRRPLQLEVEWSAPTRALSLDAITVRISHGRNATTGQMLEERGRHAVECRSISLK